MQSLGENLSNSITIDSADDSEIPQWRKDLSSRLQKLKLKREQEGEPEREAEESSPPSVEQTAVSADEEATRERLPAPTPHTPPLFQDLFEEIQKEEPAEGRSLSRDEITHSQKKTDNIEDLADRPVKQRQPSPDEPAEGLFLPGIQIPAPAEDKLILLSRTLAGLVDLIIVFMCASTFILAADFVSGIRVFDSTSVKNYGLLTTAIFFLYSMFFLGTANQTIGMMITELRVVDRRHHRPGLTKLLFRSATFILSLVPLGLGLLWGCFDRESACLHDKLSRTRVVRLNFPPVYYRP